MPMLHETPRRQRKGQGALRRVITAALTVFAVGAAMLGTVQPAAAAEDTDYYGGTYSADLSPAPPMGFNAWLSYKCNVNEDLIVEVADYIVSSGLKDAGYEYINLDDCWEGATRDADGRLQNDPVTFPHGIAWLGEYIHSKGLKFGIYSAASPVTCKGRPASDGYYDIDMQTFADWGVDYIKMDICGAAGNTEIKQNCDNTTISRMYEGRFREAAQAIIDTGRDMILAVSAPASIAAQCGYNSVAYADAMEWTPHYGQLWRTARDAGISWASIAKTYEPNVILSGSQSKGHWNDADMLMVGSTLPLVEQQTQFTLWAAMAAPLLISTNVADMSPEALAILSNEDIIAVNQDPLAKQGTVVQQGDGYDVLARPLANGDQAVVLFNKGESQRTITTDLTTTGMTAANPADAYTLKDLVTGEETSTTGSIQATVPAHGTVIYRVSAGADADVMPSVTVGAQSSIVDADGDYPVSVSLSNAGAAAVHDVAVSLTVPTGWGVAPAARTIATLAADSDKTVSFTLTPPDSLPAGTTTVPVTATAEFTFAGTDRALTAGTTVIAEHTYASLAEAFNSTVISADDATKTANFDGAGNSYSANALAELGATPGAALDVDGASLVWPDVNPGEPDNVAGSGALIRVPGHQFGERIVFLGAGQREASGEVTVYYHDGTSEQRTLGFPNWKMDSPEQGATFGAQPELVTKYRNTPKGPANFGLDYVVYSNSVDVDPTKSIAAVRLTSNASVHVFSFGVAAAPAPEPTPLTIALDGGVDPDAVEPGQVVTGSFTGGDPGSSATLKLGSTQVAEAEVDAVGVATFEFSVPEGAAAGPISLTAEGVDRNGQATTGSVELTIVVEEAPATESLVTVELQSHSGRTLAGGSTSVYLNGKWTAVTDADPTDEARVQISLKPGTYSFAQVYNGTRQQKQVVIASTEPQTVPFRTALVNLVLQSSTGAALDIPGKGSASYYAGSWQPITGVNTNNRAMVQAEMLPGTYSFAATYNGTRQQKQQTVKVPDLTGSANSVQSVYFHAALVKIELQDGVGTALDLPGTGSASYYAGSWRPITTASAGNPLVVEAQMLPGTYSFAATSAGERQQKQQTIVEPNINNHENSEQSVQFTF
ncbi:hypothetical protein BJ978_000449 [Agromyces terreus]|uniref:Alpha-galactosidase n=1 Tax=Agromyces terreus TaxID=424795 RepID=A0A9X2K9Y9_9MICO|nr:NEW3 domain-containing protein [Agromyces terreus]MCP2369773.1 hypothetical protein [Agromyces terreus]